MKMELLKQLPDAESPCEYKSFLIVARRRAAASSQAISVSVSNQNLNSFFFLFVSFAALIFHSVHKYILYIQPHMHKQP